MSDMGGNRRRSQQRANGKLSDKEYLSGIKEITKSIQGLKLGHRPPPVAAALLAIPGKALCKYFYFASSTLGFHENR